MQTVSSLNPAQIEVLNMMSFVNTERSWEHLKEALAKYFTQQLEDEIDILWEDGFLSEQKVVSFHTLHERTPYA